MENQDKETLLSLKKGQQHLERSIEKIALSIEKMSDKSLQTAEKTGEAIRELSESITKLIERDKVQNNRLKEIETEVETIKKWFWLAIGGGTVLFTILKEMDRFL